MKLKQLRNNLKLTQKELAKKLNVAPTTYLGYEKGTSEPSIKTLCTIADFFNISLDELLERNADVINLNYLDETRKNIIKYIFAIYHSSIYEFF